MRKTLDAELRARRHYRSTLCRRVLWGWKRVAHHASLAEVRWVNRDGRRVALRKEVVECMESHLLAWRRWVQLVREATKRYGAVGKKEEAKAFLALKQIVVRRKALRQLAVARWRDYSKAHWQLPFRGTHAISSTSGLA